MQNKVADWGLSPYERGVAPNVLQTIKLRTGQEKRKSPYDLVSDDAPCVSHFLGFRYTFLVRNYIVSVHNFFVLVRNFFSTVRNYIVLKHLD
jgi:hypothetical protein